MNKTINTVILAIQGFVLVFCALCCVYTIVLGSGSGGMQLPAAAILVALCATAYYALEGHKKSAAGSYKIMLLLNALSSLLCIVPHMFNMDAINEVPIWSTITVIGYVLCFGAYLVLALVPDLGMKKSNILIIFIFAVYMIVFINSVRLRPGAMLGDGTRFDSMRIMRHLCMWQMAINTGICNYFKYQDKKAHKGTY